MKVFRHVLRAKSRGADTVATGPAFISEMRYWSRTEIRRAVEEAGLQRLAIRADDFFSQNPQLSDLDLLSAAGKAVVLLSHAGRKAADAIPFLSRVADSLWIEAQAPSQLG